MTSMGMAFHSGTSLECIKNKSTAAKELEGFIFQFFFCLKKPMKYGKIALSKKKNGM